MAAVTGLHVTTSWTTPRNAPVYGACHVLIVPFMKRDSVVSQPHSLLPLTEKNRFGKLKNTSMIR